MKRDLSRRVFGLGVMSGMGLATLPAAADDGPRTIHESRVTLRPDGARHAEEVSRLVLVANGRAVGLELAFPVPEFPADAGIGGLAPGLGRLFHAPIAQDFAGARPAGHAVMMDRTLVVVLRAETSGRRIERAVIAHRRNSWQPIDRPYPIRVRLPTVAELDRLPRIGGAYLGNDDRLLVVVRPSIVSEPL